MNQTASILTVEENQPNRDETANKAIREVASTPSDQHIIPAEIVVSVLYGHVDQMRTAFFDGKTCPRSSCRLT